MSWVVLAGNRIPGHPAIDLVGHVWTLWNGSLGDPTRSELVAFPYSVDLMPILGGWMDIFLGSVLLRIGVPLALAWNLLCGGWLLLAGVGVAVLARVAGARQDAAIVAGVLAQLDAYLLFHLYGGRTEQAGVGVMALAVAGAIHSWRTGSRVVAVGAGLAGAAVVWTSWELGVILAAGMVVLAPGIWRGPRVSGAVRAWLLAAATTAVCAGPLVVSFLQRAAAIRALDESLPAQSASMAEAVGLLGWLGSSGTRPALGVLACILLVPFRKKLTRAALVASGVVLTGTWLLAAGPSPGWWVPGDLGLTAGLWTLYQHLPVLGWFHSPERVLVWWTLAAPVSAALVWQSLVTSKGRTVLLVALLAASGWNLYTSPWARISTWAPPSDPAWAAIRDGDSKGAVLDLPVVHHAPELVTYQLAQLSHQRPVPFHMTLPRLTPARPEELVKRLSIAQWLDTPRGGGAPSAAAFEADLETLRRDGYDWVVLWPSHRTQPPHRVAVRAFREALGPADARGQAGWRAWRIEP